MSDGEYPIDRDELLARIDLVQVLDALTSGHGDGHRRTWNCPDPDHPDVHPSVTVRTDHRGVQRWRCWSGGHGGTAIDAVLAARHLDVGEAIRWLDEHYAHLRPIDRNPPSARREVGHPALEVVEYVERCAKLLWSGSGRQVREWLNVRGYPDDVLAANKVGADPGRRYLPRPKGFPGGWPAAVYPVLDPEGVVTYFQARYIDPPDGRGKYDNPSSRWATNPRLGWVRPSRPQVDVDRTLVVTEGVADALVAARLGHSGVGLLGTAAIDAASAQRIASWACEHARRVVVCFDGDDAGQVGARRVAEALIAAGIEDALRVLPPDGMDLTDWARQDSSAIVAELAVAHPLRPTTNAVMAPSYSLVE